MSLNNIRNNNSNPISKFVLLSYIDQYRLLELLNYSIQLSKSVKKIPKPQNGKYLEIAKEHKIFTESTKELQEINKELLDTVNNLYKNQINLYNLISGINKFIENNKTDMFIDDKENIIQYLLNQNTTEQEDLVFENTFKLDGFKKIIFQEYRIDNIDKLSKSELENINLELSDEIEKIHQNIMYLLNIGREYNKVDKSEIDINNIEDIMSLQSLPILPKQKKQKTAIEIIDKSQEPQHPQEPQDPQEPQEPQEPQVIQKQEEEQDKEIYELFEFFQGKKKKKPKKENKLSKLDIVSNIPQEGGGDIENVLKLLEKLKNNLDGVSSLTLEKEIPGGINLELDLIKKILSDFKFTLELQAKPGDDDNQDKYKKQWEYNLFEEIPEYKTIKYDNKKGFILNPLQPTTPQETEKILDSDVLIKIIKEKEKYIDEKITDISSIIGDIISFIRKLQNYRTNELAQTNKYNYTFTNIAEKKDLQERIVELNTLIQQKKIESENKNKLKEFLNDQQFTEYLIKKEELVNRPVSNQEEEYKELINLMFEGLLTKPQEPLNNGIIDERLKNALDHMIEKRPVKGYENGFFLNDSNYRQYDKVKNYLESFRNAAPEVQRSQIKLNNPTTDINPNLFQTLFIKYQKSNVDSRNNKYVKIIEKLNDMEIKYNKKDELKETVDTIETTTPLYLENYTIYKSDPEFDMTKINESIENKKSNIDKVIETFKEEFTNLEKELKNLEELVRDYKENTNYSNMININKNSLSTKIGLLHQKLLQINDNIKLVFNLKDGIDDVKKINILENTIIHSQNNITPNWFKGQQGGTNYIFNIDNINKINDINNAMKRLLIKTEKYKSISTDLLESYVIFIKNIQSVIIYIYYKLTVLEDIKNNRFKIFKKFNQTTLDNLKKNISQIKRKNFDLIKEYYTSIINDILDKQTKLKDSNKEYKFVKYDNTIKDNNGLLNLFVLVHIESYHDKY